LLDGTPPPWRKGKRSGMFPDATKCPSGCGGPCGAESKEKDTHTPPSAAEWVGGSRPNHLHKQRKGDGTPGFCVPAGFFGVPNLRLRTVVVGRQLETVHPNPGPGVRRGVRGRGEENRRRRREGRHRRRRERRQGRVGEGEERVRGGGGRGECNIVTWNVQRMSLRENNRGRLRRVVEYCERSGWEIVCLTELKTEDVGVVWLGEEETQVAVVHSKRSGVLLRGVALRRWIEEGQQKWMDERVTAVVLGGLRVVSAYQPLWGRDEREFERYRRDLESQVAVGGRERLVIGGDFNANVGRGEPVEGVCGKYGVGGRSEAGRDLLEWCGLHDLAWVNGYMRHARRGTWFSAPLGRWFELDGFIVRKRERHGMVRKMCSVEEMTLSDHKPKKMVVRVRSKRWRVEKKEARRPKVEWEKLGEEGKREEFRRKTEEKMEEVQWQDGEERTEWDKVTEVLVEAAKEVCGESSRSVQHPWLVGQEGELERLRGEIQASVVRRNEAVRRRAPRMRLRERVRENDRIMERLQAEVEEAREEVKMTRRRKRL